MREEGGIAMAVAAARANTTAIVSSTESGSTESEAEPTSDCTAGDEAGLRRRERGAVLA